MTSQLKYLPSWRSPSPSGDEDAMFVIKQFTDGDDQDALEVMDAIKQFAEEDDFQVSAHAGTCVEGNMERVWKGVQNNFKQRTSFSRTNLMTLQAVPAVITAKRVSIRSSRVKREYSLHTCIIPFIFIAIWQR